MKQSPVRVFPVLLFVFVGCFGVAFAAAGMLDALPTPAIGGTCGPSTASESALEALAEPGSIGAGPEPPASNVTGHRQWQTFISQCQTLADRRGLQSLAILVISVVVAGVGLVWVLRRSRASDSDSDDESIDPTTGLPRGSGPDRPDALVSVGAPVAPSGAPYAGTVGYPPQQAFAPAAPYPGQPYPGHPYPPAPPGHHPGAAYPPQQGWSTPPPPSAYPSPYPAPPTYPTVPGYPPPPQPPAPPTAAPPPPPDPSPAPPAGPAGEAADDEPGPDGQPDQPGA